VRSDGEPWDLLRRAGFTDIEVTDVTGEFLATARGWFAHASRLEQTSGSTGTTKHSRSGRRTDDRSYARSKMGSCRAPSSWG
jgi:hypothetical protein